MQEAERYVAVSVVQGDADREEVVKCNGADELGNRASRRIWVEWWSTTVSLSGDQGKRARRANKARKESKSCVIMAWLTVRTKVWSYGEGRTCSGKGEEGPVIVKVENKGEKVRRDGDTNTNLADRYTCQ